VEIKVLGSGCSKCRSTIGVIERAAHASRVDVAIVKVENADEIRRSGVKATPAVMIDGKLVHSGGMTDDMTAIMSRLPGVVPGCGPASKDSQCPHMS